MTLMSGLLRGELLQSHERMSVLAEGRPPEVSGQSERASLKGLHWAGRVKWACSRPLQCPPALGHYSFRQGRKLIPYSILDLSLECPCFDFNMIR